MSPAPALIARSATGCASVTRASRTAVACKPLRGSPLSHTRTAAHQRAHIFLSNKGCGVLKGSLHMQAYADNYGEPEDTPPPDLGGDIRDRFRKRVLNELTELAEKSGHAREDFQTNIAQLETLMGTFTPDLNKLKESEWVEFVADASNIAKKIVLLKTYFPSLDATALMAKKPKIFLKSMDEIREVSGQVSKLLEEAPDPGSILSSTPDLFDPAMVASVLVTFQRWFPKDDPIEKLQTEGAMILERAQANDMPLDPVYYDGVSWKAPAFDTQSKQLPWQEHIRTKVNKLPPLHTIKNSGKYTPS